MTLTSSRTRFAQLMTAISLFALVVAVTGCSTATPGTQEPSGSVPTETPGITGAITYLAAGTGGTASLGSITVEGGEQPEGAVSDKAVVKVTKETAIFDAAGKPTTPDKLQVGTEVKVWFTGPVAESYPVQGAASAVQVTGIAPK